MTPLRPKRSISHAWLAPVFVLSVVIVAFRPPWPWWTILLAGALWPLLTHAHELRRVLTAGVRDRARLGLLLRQEAGLEDPRKAGLKAGLRQLTTAQLRRVLTYPGTMVLDAVNYRDGCFCPLAVGVGLDQTMTDPTHERVFDALSSMGYRVYNTRGIKGVFYTLERARDLRIATREVLAERRWWRFPGAA